MSTVNFEIKIPGDIEGFVTFECPFCESEFKLNASECQDDKNPYKEFFCPYCGLVHEISHFYSKEIIEYIQAIATNYMFEQINKTFAGMKSSINRTKGMKIEFKPLKKVHLKDLKEKETVEEIFECPMCGNHEKVLYCAGASKVFCAYCGVDI